MILREYQSALSLEVRKALAKHRKVINCAPTGGGKTAIAKDYVIRASNKDIICVFLSDRVEILEQTCSTFTKSGIDFSVVDSNVKVITPHKVYVCMTETFYRRFSSGKFRNINIGLLILDECHVGNYSKIIQMMDKLEKPPFVIGLTATPISSSNKLPLNKLYDTIICGPSVPWLVENKFLCPSIDIGQKDLYDFEKKNGEFTNESVLANFKKKGSDKKMFNLWKKHASDRKTIVYNISIEHNKEVADLFIREGVSCETVSSEDTDYHRKKVISNFRKGITQVVCNVGILTKGFDAPETSCIVENFATDSLSKHIQVVGRGARPFPGKEDFIVIDMGNNIIRHGSYNDEIDWEFVFKNDTRGRGFKEKQSTYLCPVCYAYIYNKFQSECNVCSSVLTEKTLIKFELEIPEHIKKKNPDDLEWDEIDLYRKWKNYKSGWAWMMRNRLKTRRAFSRLK